MMKYNSIEAFVPSGKDFGASRDFFIALGFSTVRESADYISFDNSGCRFILQNFDNKEFAENLMMRVAVDDLDAFWREISEKNLPEKFNVKIQAPTDFPWGREVNVIDIAGVCWHFVQSE